MSSKAKRPTPAERLVRVKDILPVLETMSTALVDLNDRLKALEAKAQEPAS